MLEHLRVDSIPDGYILKRYSRGANLIHSFNRNDTRTVAYDGSSVAYNHNEVMQLCFRLARAASKSDVETVVSKNGLIELIDKVEALGCSTAGSDDEEGGIPPFSNFEPDMEKIFKQTNKTNTQPEPRARVIHPPPMSKTKGSGTKARRSKDKAAAIQKQLLYDERFEPGQRICSVCGLKQRHNARNCPLLDDPPKIYDAAQAAIYGGKFAGAAPAAKKQTAAGIASAANKNSVATKANGDDGSEGKRKRGRRCGQCREFSKGHNALTCTKRAQKLEQLNAHKKSKQKKSEEEEDDENDEEEEEGDDEEEEEELEEDDEDDEEEEEDDEEEDGEEEEDDEEDEYDEVQVEEENQEAKQPKKSSRRKYGQEEAEEEPEISVKKMMKSSRSRKLYDKEEDEELLQEKHPATAAKKRSTRGKTAVDLAVRPTPRRSNRRGKPDEKEEENEEQAGKEQEKVQVTEAATSAKKRSKGKTTVDQAATPTSRRSSRLAMI